MTYNDIVVGTVVECEVIPTQVHLVFECTDEEYKIFREVMKMSGAQHYERFITICEPTQ
jgi:hypothetical protein